MAHRNRTTEHDTNTTPSLIDVIKRKAMEVGVGVTALTALVGCSAQAQESTQDETIPASAPANSSEKPSPSNEGAVGTTDPSDSRPTPGSPSADIPATTPSGIETTQPATTPHVSPIESPAEQIESDGLHTEIPRDQLNIMEQTISVEAMEAMSVMEFAKLSSPDRSAYGYALMQRILSDDVRTYNVNTLSNDNTSFYYDPANNVKSGNLVMSAIDTQRGHLAGGNMTPDQAKKYALASEYSPYELTGGTLTASITETMEEYARIAQVDAVEIIPQAVVKETGWLSGVDYAGQKQWFKVMECITQSNTDSSILSDQTFQMVRTTVHMLNGQDIFWYMRGAASDRQAGDLVSEYAAQPIR